MAIDPKYLKASDGTGSAVLAHVTANRLANATTLKVDNIDNWSPFFIATSGVLNAQGYITESTKKEFRGHLSGTDIIIDGFEAGFTDNGNTTNEVVVIKQTTGWADGVADNIINQNTTIANFLASAGDWRVLSPVPTVDTVYSNNSYLLRFTGVDLTTTLYQSMKLKLPRTGTTPTQNALIINASNQYFQRSTTISGVTFTGDFTVEGNLRMLRYPPSSEFRLLNRDGAGGVNGWATAVDNVGRVFVFYRNGSNYTLFRTEQSIKLDRSYHLAFVVNVAAKTAQIYVDGEPWQQTIGESSATNVLNQSTYNIQFGATNGASSFDGTASEWRLWSTARTQQQVLDNKDKQLVGNEAGLVGLWHFNGDANDSSPNANHMSAINGAIATNPENAYSANEFAFVERVVKSGSDTLVDVFSGSGRIPKETLGAVAYSVADNPYGFPRHKEHWRISMIQMAAKNVGVGSFDAWTSTPLYMNVPVGRWTLGYQIHLEQSNTTAAAVAIRAYLGKDGFASPAELDMRMVAGGYISAGMSAASWEYNRFGKALNLTARQLYRLYGAAGTGGGSVSFYIQSGYSASEIYVDCPWV